MICTALLCALAYIAVFIGKLVPISVISFLKYDPKDIIIAIGGFIYGPLTAFVISLITSILEMVTISDTNIIGCVMNVVASCAFACVASAVYYRKRNSVHACAGLLLGCVSMTASMLVWNYLLTPLYMGIPRGDVVKMLLPVFLPFNLIKSLLNSAFIIIIYKPFVRMLRKSGIVEDREYSGSKKMNVPIYAAAIFVILMCAAAVFIING